MGHGAGLDARHRATGWLCAAFLGVAAIFSLPLDARAQDTAIMARGDAAVTAFSGARQIGKVPADLHPLDLTFIDINGATLQVFDLTELGGAADGQVVNAPTKFKATAGEIGQSAWRSTATAPMQPQYLRHLDLAVRLADRRR
jgi:hypothetical protein